MPAEMQDKQPMKGCFELIIKDKDGNVVRHIKENNMIVAQAKQSMAKFIANAGVDNLYVSRLLVGTGTTDAGLLNTAATFTNTYATDLLTTEGQQGELITGQDNIEGTAVRFTWELGPNECVGMNITEFGLACADGDTNEAINDGTATTLPTLFARRKRADAIYKGEDLSFTGTWTIIF